MRSKGFEGMTCSAASVMGALGDRWGLLIVRDLYFGLARYDDLQRSTGVTNITLSDRLKVLEQNGLLERRQTQSHAGRYEYVLTAKGRDIAIVLFAMVQVGDKWNLPGLLGPPVRFVDARSGHRLKLALVDAETGKPVDPKHMSAEAGPGADDLTKWRISHGGRRN